MASPSSRSRTLVLAGVLAVTAGGALWYQTSGRANAPQAPAVGGSFGELRDPPLSVTPLAQVAAHLVGAVFSPDGTLFAIGRHGIVYRVEDGALSPWLDLQDRVGSGSSEQGLLGLAFDPAWPTAGRLYVNYTNLDGDTRVSRFVTSAGAGPASSDEEILLTIGQPAANHNGGHIAFGPDGLLYIATGDGGRGGDPWNNAQNPTVQLGKLLRIDVSAATGFAIPAGQPCSVRGRNADPTVFAIGLRNPWRFSFDPLDGSLWVADVGQGRIEEINHVAVPTPCMDFGWRPFEGDECYAPRDGCEPAGRVMPVFVYPHPAGCSVTGGITLRGAQWGSLQGAYLYADFCANGLMALSQDAHGGWTSQRLLEGVNAVAAMAQHEDGRVVIVELRGKLLELQPPAP